MSRDAAAATLAPQGAAPYPGQVSPPAQLALFDLDRTLVRGSSLAAFGRAAAASGLVRRRSLATAGLADLRFRLGGANDAKVAEVRDRALAICAGVDRGPLLELAASVADDLVAGMAPGARMLLERHLGRGDFCAVVSASPQELVEAVAARLGVHRAIGTRAEVVDDRLTGRLAGPFCYGRGKLARIGEALGAVDLTRAWAYADSMSDLPLLDACGHPVAVNPDRRLRAVAARAGWPVLHVS